MGDLELRGALERQPELLLWVGGAFACARIWNSAVFFDRERFGRAIGTCFSRPWIIWIFRCSCLGNVWVPPRIFAPGNVAPTDCLMVDLFAGDRFDTDSSAHSLWP